MFDYDDLEEQAPPPPRQLAAEVVPGGAATASSSGRADAKADAAKRDLSAEREALIERLKRGTLPEPEPRHAASSGGRARSREGSPEPGGGGADLGEVAAPAVLAHHDLLERIKKAAPDLRHVAAAAAPADGQEPRHLPDAVEEDYDEDAAPWHGKDEDGDAQRPTIFSVLPRRMPERRFSVKRQGPDKGCLTNPDLALFRRNVDSQAADAAGAVAKADGHHAASGSRASGRPTPAKASELRAATRRRASDLSNTQEQEAARREAKAVEDAMVAKRLKERTREKEEEDQAREASTWALRREWGPGTHLFEVEGRVLPMHTDSDSVTPIEVVRIWESWGCAYADRLRFAAQPDHGTRWLNMRQDMLPPPPAVTGLKGTESIVQSVGLALVQRDEEALRRVTDSGGRRLSRADQHGGTWRKQEEGFKWQAPAPPGAQRLNASSGIWPPRAFTWVSTPPDGESA